jgi:hypothetical protein
MQAIHGERQESVPCAAASAERAEAVVAEEGSQQCRRRRSAKR